MPKPTITEFLEARIAEDEAVARGSDHVDGVRWRYDPERSCVWDGVGTAAANNTRPAANSRTGEHIARHDPARVLAECAAKRAIARLAADAGSLDDLQASSDIGYDDIEAKILGALASTYASHPDYQQGWAL